MKKILHLTIGYWLLALLLTACKTGEKVSTDGTTTIDKTFSKKDFMNTVADRALTSQYVTAKLKFSATMAGQSVSVGGSLKMKRDDVIRIQLVAFGIMEAGRLEFTKDYVLIMDRINKQYVKASYDDIDFLRTNNVNFHTLQALFWNELFQPGKEQPSLDKFAATPQEEGDVLITLSSGRLDYQWEADRETGKINSTTISHDNQGTTDGEMNWKYRSFKKLGQKQFPTDQQVRIKADGKTLQAGFQLSSLEHDSSWEKRTTVSNKYKKVSAETIFRRLLSL